MVIYVNTKTTKIVGLVVSELGEMSTVLHSGQVMSESWSIFGRWCDDRVNPLVVSLATVGADWGTVLIHWDLPTDNKTTFSLRFTFIGSGVG